MKISPVSIKRQEFGKSVRGYNVDEVHVFLEKVADAVEDLQKENDKLKKELDDLTEKVGEYRKIEKNLQATLLKAQENSAKSVESTKKQTTLMIKEAEIKASQILEKARESANEIRNAVINLREERDLIIAKLKAIVNPQAHLLNVKVEYSGEEPAELKTIEQPKKVSVDVDNIVNKLL
jgi:cell division initiation protein